MFINTVITTLKVLASICLTAGVIVFLVLFAVGISPEDRNVLPLTLAHSIVFFMSIGVLFVSVAQWAVFMAIAYGLNCVYDIRTGNNPPDHYA